MARPRRNKYNNTKTVRNERVFDSKMEAEHSKQLDGLRWSKEPSKRVKSVLYQYRIPVEVNGIHICDYRADFYVSFADGRKEIHEVKGVKTEVYKLKKKLVEAIYGEKIIEYGK